MKKVSFKLWIFFFKYCRAWSGMAWTCRHYIFISSWREWMYCEMWIFFVIWWKSTKDHPLLITEKKKNGWYVFFTAWKEFGPIFVDYQTSAGTLGRTWKTVLLHYNGRIFIILLIYLHGDVNSRVNVAHKILEHWSPMNNDDSTVTSYPCNM